METTIRTADGRMFAVDENGNVRELRGLLLERQRTMDDIDAERFSKQPQYDTLKGVVDLPGGRRAYDVLVDPPGGLPQDVYLDTRTLMIDRQSYDEDDATQTIDFYNYKVYGGALVPGTEVDSNGDHAFDITRKLLRVVADSTIDPAIFQVPKNTEIQASGDVTVPVHNIGDHLFTTVTIHGHPYTFLIDTGAQEIVLDSRVATQLNLVPQGRQEIVGAQRIGGLGIAQLDGIQIGSATLPLKSVTVLNLGQAISQPIDGVLGFPFFASAEVEIDAADGRMRFAKPGMLSHPQGTKVPIDVDRSLIEVQGRVNGAEGRFVLDTGNSSELLLFEPFMVKHPALVTTRFNIVSNMGVGGTVHAINATVDRLDFSGFTFFHRHSNLMLADKGAFADRYDAGNIGMATLLNLIVTFDVANDQAYMARAFSFDDGRYRDQPESITF